MEPHLYLGNRNYSSWSLRAWIALRWAGVAFGESLVELDRPGYGRRRIAGVLAVSPSGLVPALRIGAVTVWDTIAIAEWAAERARTPLLPGDPVRRALVRAVVGEMHSGFASLRRELPMNIRRRCIASGFSPETQDDIDRIDGLWSRLRAEHGAGGPWLFGERTLADAFYLPVATRFRTYGIALSPLAQAWRDQALSDPDFGQWERTVLAEPARPFSQAGIDTLYAAPDSARETRP